MPFRNVFNELKQFVPHMHRYLAEQVEREQGQPKKKKRRGEGWGARKEKWSKGKAAAAHSSFFPFFLIVFSESFVFHLCCEPDRRPPIQPWSAAQHWRHRGMHRPFLLMSVIPLTVTFFCLFVCQAEKDGCDYAVLHDVDLLPDNPALP